jgi:hypothetical protein
VVVVVVVMVVAAVEPTVIKVFWGITCYIVQILFGNKIVRYNLNISHYHCVSNFILIKAISYRSLRHGFYLFPHQITLSGSSGSLVIAINLKAKY